MEFMPQPITDELLAVAFDPQKLQEALDFVSQKKTRGIDGTTVDKFLENKQENFDLIKEKWVESSSKCTTEKMG
jgi:hypothetical protein